MNFLLLAFFEQIFKILNTFTSDITTDGLLAIAGVLFLITIITSICIACSSVEFKTNKQTSKLNTYLSTKPFINDDNILEFNKLMQRVPRNMREQWQKYMINRNAKASNFLNSQNCVDAIVRNGTYGNLVNSYLKYFTYIFAFVLFVLSMCNEPSTSSFVSDTYFFDMLAIPVLYILVSNVAMIIFKAIYNAIINDLYHNMSIFERNIDRATSTLPDVIDYEILFTKKEIKNNIPVLQEYLEQRAEYEEQQLIKARLNEVEHEVYDFSKLGVDGSIVMERALKESEDYLANRRRILNEVDQIQNEKFGIKKEYDDKTKEARQKINTHKETLSELNIQLQNTSGKIMADNIKNQMKDISKQIQIIEQDMDVVEQRFNSDIAKLDVEINARQEEMQEKKSNVEKNLIHEFNEYSTRINNALRSDASQNSQEVIKNMELEIAELKEKLEQKDAIINENNQILRDKDDFIAELSNQITQVEAEKQAIIDNANVIEKEIIRNFDANGRQFFYDDDNNPFYYDDHGEIVYYDAIVDEGEENLEEDYPEIDENEIFEEPEEDDEYYDEEDYGDGELVEVEDEFEEEEPQYEEQQDEFEDEFEEELQTEQAQDEFEDEFAEPEQEQEKDEFADEFEENDEMGIASIEDEFEKEEVVEEEKEEPASEELEQLEEEIEEPEEEIEESEEEIEEEFEEEDEEDEEENEMTQTIKQLQDEIQKLKKESEDEKLRLEIKKLQEEKQRLEQLKEQSAVEKRGRGRPKGSFKVKQPVQEAEQKRGRGRPKGSVKKVESAPTPAKRGRKSKRGRPRKNV